EAGEADLDAGALEELRGAAHGLVRGLQEIERVHLAARGLGVVIGNDRAGVEVGRERFVSGQCEAVADALDLLLQAPPLLDDDHAWSLGTSGLGEIPRRPLAVRPWECDVGAHALLPRLDLALSDESRARR